MQKPLDILFFRVQVVDNSFGVVLNGRGEDIDLEDLAHCLEKYLAEGSHVEANPSTCRVQFNLCYLMVLD